MTSSGSRWPGTLVAVAVTVAGCSAADGGGRRRTAADLARSRSQPGRLTGTAQRWSALTIGCATT